MNANASKEHSVAIGEGSTTDTSATAVPSATINGITYTFAGSQSDAGQQVSVGTATSTRQIKNVAPGALTATSTDAVNGSQLFAVASQISPPLKYVSIKSSETGTDSNSNNDGAAGADSIAIVLKAKSTGTNGISLGNTAVAAGNNSFALGTNSIANGSDALLLLVVVLKLKTIQLLKVLQSVLMLLWVKE